MKKLFFLLLLGNVVFYLWATNIQPKQDKSRRLAVDSSLEPIVLVSELKVKKQVKFEESSPEKSNVLKAPEKVNQPVVTSDTCFYTAHLNDRKTAVTLQSVLQKNAIRSEIVVEKVVENAGYWAMYPPAADMKQARANVRFLKDKGVKDYWLFRKGSRKGAISLGMFKEQRRAERIKKEWAKRGVELEIKPHLVRRDRFTLEIRTSRQLAELIKLANKSSEAVIEIKLEDNHCN